MSIQTQPLERFYKTCRFGRGKYWFLFPNPPRRWRPRSRSDLVQHLRVEYKLFPKQARAVLDDIKKAATAEDDPELAHIIEWYHWTKGCARCVQFEHVHFVDHKLQAIKSMTIEAYNRVIRARFPEKSEVYPSICQWILD